MDSNPAVARTSPPDLASSEWATEFNETKAMGRSKGFVRTAEQTDIARFFSSNAIIQFNTLFKQITLDGGLDAVDAARLYGDERDRYRSDGHRAQPLARDASL